MLKPKEHLVVGGWVVVESIVMNRHLAQPWQVCKIAGDRLYVERFRFDDILQEWEKTDEKFISRKSVLYVFDDEETATAAFNFSRKLSEDFHNAVDALKALHNKSFLDHMAALPVNLTPPPAPSPELAAESVKIATKATKPRKKTVRKPKPTAAL